MSRKNRPRKNVASREGKKMPGKIKDITFPDGQTRKVEELDFEIVREDWNEYQLTDGSYMKIKTIVKKVYWILDNTGNRRYTEEGDPFLLVSSVNQVVASE
jgi:hypothetical protein